MTYLKLSDFNLRMSLDIMHSVDRFCINRENGTDGMDKNGGEMSGYLFKGDSS